MKGLTLSELEENNVYQCQISGCKVLVAHKPVGESSLRGLYFYEGSFMTMDIRDGQLIEITNRGTLRSGLDKARDFLKGKDLLLPDCTEFVITYPGGRKVIINELLVDFAELNIAEMKLAHQWGLSD